ncbi:hypothetical protein M0802_001081 [Mischocyttarus mexicanus]|nr:hypothetical protein M0802_001081 [Mischocyttarus mexicanus]
MKIRVMVRGGGGGGGGEVLVNTASLLSYQVSEHSHECYRDDASETTVPGLGFRASDNGIKEPPLRSAQLCFAQLSSAQFSSAQLSSAQLSSAQHSLAQLNSVQLCLLFLFLYLS